MYLTTIAKNMPEFNSFNFWFERIRSNQFNVIDLNTKEVICAFVDDDKFPIVSGLDESKYNMEEIIEQFTRFTNRPEYLVGHELPQDVFIDEESKRYTYECLLVGVIFIRAYNAGKYPDESTKAVTNALNWLDETDFYTAPASTQYHESCPGGLLSHTLQVYNQMCRLHDCKPFRETKYHSATLVALVHDWCKIGLYEMYRRNVKNEETGKWEQVPSYRYSDKSIVPLGHGASSMYVASKLFRLSTDEAVAIRWHMNSWNVAPNEMNDLQRANETYPLVHLLQFADQLSITSYRDSGDVTLNG